MARKGEGLGQITDTVSIRKRQVSAENRVVPDHWAGDLIFGSKGSQIATLIERQTRYVLLAKVDGKDASQGIRMLEHTLLKYGTEGQK